MTDFKRIALEDGVDKKSRILLLINILSIKNYLAGDGNDVVDDNLMNVVPENNEGMIL